MEIEIKQKLIIILNALIPMFACIQLFRALIAAYRIEIQIKTLRYDLAEDKKIYEKAGRLFMYVLILSDLTWFLCNLSRIGFEGKWNWFASPFIASVSLLLSTLLAIKAQLALMFYRNCKFTFLKNIKI